VFSMIQKVLSSFNRIITSEVDEVWISGEVPEFEEVYAKTPV
jgi:hypothetical protein